jgi:ABC-type transport system involved in cytochrome c biogenesis permease component
MKSLKISIREKAVVFFRHVFATLAILVISLSLYAQDGNAGITQATSQVKGYFSTGTSLMYAIGAIMGLVGAIKVFKKWNDGEHDTGKVASSWFGSCIFLVVVASVLKSFFGV